MSDMLDRMGTDPAKWAEEFIKLFHGKGMEGDVDEGLMLGWFANAMVAAESAATRKLTVKNLEGYIGLSTGPTCAVDFDGVLHAYSRGWEDGVIYDDAMPGAFAALDRMMASGYRIVVFTVREDLQAVVVWLKQQHLWQFVSEVTRLKPPATMYIDDRAVRWESWEHTLTDLIMKGLVM